MPSSPFAVRRSAAAGNNSGNRALPANPYLH
jgi:hypothetical protein